MYSIRYPVPFSSKHSNERPTRETLCLNWARSKPGFTGMDVATFVRGRFSAHNKDVSSASVQSKIDNTIAFITAVTEP
jgi:hypothetical protein